MGAKKGVIFSIDAFVAFGLILIAIYGLFVLIGTPNSYFTSLEQTADIAHDTLLSLSRLDNGGISMLDTVARDYDRSNPTLSPAVNSFAERAIPIQFGYRFEIYDTGLPVPGWVELVAGRNPNRSNITYANAKIAASAQAPVTYYEIPRNTGQSPWCYQTCRGYEGIGKDGLPQYAGIGPGGKFAYCQNTPCSTPANSSFVPGKLAIGWVRLTVFI